MPQIRKKSPAQYRTEMLRHAFPEYLDLVEYRERVDDCLQGQRTIKRKMKYIPPTKWQSEHPDEYAAYVGRALFYSLTAYAMRIYEGLVMSGKPTINLPTDNRMDFLKKQATIHGRDLHALQYNLNREQFSHGLRCMLTETTNDDKRSIYIQEFCANAFLAVHFTKKDGTLSKPKCILLDQTTMKYNLQTKQYEYDPKLLVLGLDGNDTYYQAEIDPMLWTAFDVNNPPSDCVIYPKWHGRTIDFIPFTWCGASSLSGATLDIPPLLDMCDCEIKLFQCDAMYSNHLFQSAQETTFFLNAPGDFNIDNVRYGSGAHNKLMKGMDVKVVSNNGVGFAAEKEYMDSIMAQIELRRMSIMSTKSHQSGTAVGIAQSAQTAPLRTIVDTSGDAITEQLRYAARWMGYSDAEVNEIMYCPSQDFSHTDANLNEFVTLCQAVSEGVVPMLDSDLYRMALENGYISTKEDWTSFKRKWNMEQAKREESLGYAATKPPATENGNLEGIEGMTTVNSEPFAVMARNRK